MHAADLPDGSRTRRPMASTHLFHFRSPRAAARSLFVDRHGLASTTGLLFHRLVFVGSLRTEGFTFGLVDPRRQMAMCLWDDETSLERFLHDTPTGRAWREQTDEYCEVRMTPFRSHGTYRGLEPLAGLAPEPPGDGPAALWTFANIPPRGLGFFWSEIRGAAARLLTAPGLIAGTAGPEHLYRGAMTFTIWERLDSALGFAYRQEPHRRIVKDVRADRRLIDSMFIRLRPYAATGSWPARSRFASRFERFARALEATPPEGRAPGPRGPTRSPAAGRSPTR
jgi:hypothetical protein